MELTHTFTVPASVDRTWATFMDLELVGGCFPGATVTEVGDDGFAGTVKVKLGPIALVYAGSGAFRERDDGAHRAVIEAKGKDKRGNGTAGATVTIQLTDAGEGRTRADVQSDLAVTGKPAQFGRGVMQDVSDKLLQQFVDCIEGKLGPPAAVPSAAAESPPAESPPVESPPAESPPVESPPAEPAPAPAEQPSAAAGPSHPTAESTTSAEPRAPQPAAAEPAVAADVPAAARRVLGEHRRDDAIDLGSTVLPVLLRSYGKRVAAGALAVLAVVGLAWARRRRRT